MKPPHILVVDDEPVARKTLEAILHGQGYDLELVSGGEEGLLRAEASPPDLVLLDVMMPGLTGYDVCRRLRQSPTLSEVPIILVTGLNDTFSRITGLDAGADDFVSKPYDVQELRARVRTIVRLARMRKLAEERMRFSRLAEVSPFGISLVDPAGSVLFANPALLRMLHVEDADGLGGRPLTPFVAGERREAFVSALAALFDGPDAPSSFETTLLPSGGAPFRAAVDGIRLAWERQPVAQLVVRDISVQKRHEAELERRANFDRVTGLANRNLLGDRLEQALAQAKATHQTVAVVSLDLDRLRRVNDSLGRPAGDAVLREAGLRLLSLGFPNATVARAGGDEFVLVLPAFGYEAAAAAAQGAIATISTPFRIGPAGVFISARAGIALFPGDGDDVEGLLRSAEAAMHRAEDEGPNAIRFSSPEIDGRASLRLRIESDLYRAIEAGEFSLAYQPQYSATDGTLAGTEALLRWNHAELGPISPVDFIPIAEEIGQIVPIGRWVIQAVCAQIASWRDAGLSPTCVWVNASALQIASPSFPRDVEAALAANGVPAYQVGIELTESALERRPEEALAVLESLHRLGLSLALDDFGTGYSSLSRLSRIPLEFLKIDRSFVQGVVSDPRDAALASSVIALARGLGLKTVAEGVETPAQARFLEAHGCDYFQGFLFGRPMSADAFASLLRPTA